LAQEQGNIGSSFTFYCYRYVHISLFVAKVNIAPFIFSIRFAFLLKRFFSIEMDLSILSQCFSTNAKMTKKNQNGFAGKQIKFRIMTYQFHTISILNRKSDLFLTTFYLLFAALLKSILTVFTFGSRVPAVSSHFHISQ
jgi:hypothetical protein